MRQVIAFAIVLSSAIAFGQAQPQSSQTAREALLEMFFGETPNHMEKHLADATRKSLNKFGGGQNYFSEFSMLASQIRREGTKLQTFDAGPILVSAEDPRPGAMGPDKIELTVERDDLVGDEDQIELALHMSKNGKEQDLPVIPRFTFSMQSEANVWKLNEIIVTVRVPLSDPSFLKIIEDQQRSRNEMMAMGMLRVLNSAEKNYSSVKGRYACQLSLLGTQYLYDPDLIKGVKDGYNFVISGCDASHYRAVAEPAVADSEQRAFCSDESGEIRAASDGKATTCLSSGEVAQETMGDRATGIGVVSARPPTNAQAIAASQQPRAVLRPERPTSGGSDSAPMPTRIRVSQGVMKGLVVKEVQPVYPTMDKINIEGTVLLSVIVGKDGTVQSAKVVNTPSPLLNQAALDAVKQWKFRPYLLNGSPLEVETTITLTFTLPKR